MKARNLIGPAGAYAADLCIQMFGLASFGLPLMLWALAWKWARSQPIQAGLAKILGTILLVASSSAALALAPAFYPWGGNLPASGVMGMLLADFGLVRLNLAGTLLFDALVFILSLYLLTRFSMVHAVSWWERPMRIVGNWQERWAAWRRAQRVAAQEKAKLRTAKLPPPATEVIRSRCA